MAQGPKRTAKEFYALLILLVVLQAAAIGLVLRFAADMTERDTTLLERTGTMMEKIFPGLQGDVADLSRKATELKGDMSDLKNQVTRVDENLGQVGRDVSDVGRVVKNVDTSVTGFVQDKSGLVWGHSLNPYLLLALIAAMMLSVPIWGWFFSNRAKTVEPIQQEAVPVSAMESFSLRLDKLSALVEKIGTTERTSEKPSPQLQELMLQTERLIQETRDELVQLGVEGRSASTDGDRAGGSLH